jgi:oligosaccharyl transferase complex subunit OST4
LEADPYQTPLAKMITDDGLYRLAIFLGSAAMLLIILYHFLEVNAVREPESDRKHLKAAPSRAEKSTSSTR